ncbi:MAG: class I SAM-dependent methyltransferase [Acidobacteria bacterium]|nr:class I SAM-dependent methyltransferase [Acidobacteriota bacterium]
MTIFDDFSTVYDHMFPWETRKRNEGDFFPRLFVERGVKRVLDCACGTGMHVIQFAGLGLEAHGSDLAPTMVEAARENARREEVAADFRVCSFTELLKGFAGVERFDAVVCLGNSLTLAPTDADVARALWQMHGMLRPGGIAVVHIFNWDKLARERLRIMPATASALDGHEVTFLRVFHHRGDRIDLNIVVVTREGERVQTRVLTAVQRPVGPGRLVGLAREAGFRRLETFAGYDRRPFDPESSDQLVLLASVPPAGK